MKPSRYESERPGAFFRHRKNGHFILAIESGLHTNAETGNSYRTFAVWKPEAARSSYIHDDELSEKYRAVIPSKARDWWIKKHATVPPIETLETHIIGGAIIPLWQRFKTHEEARLRVVELLRTTDSELLAFEFPLSRLAQLSERLARLAICGSRTRYFPVSWTKGRKSISFPVSSFGERLFTESPSLNYAEPTPTSLRSFGSLALLMSKLIGSSDSSFRPMRNPASSAVSALLNRYPILVADEAVQARELRSLR